MKVIQYISLVIALVLYLTLSLAGREEAKMSKYEYYKKYIAPKGETEEVEKEGLKKTSSGLAIRYGRLEVGNVEATIQNTGTLGYSRWPAGKCYEFPRNSNVTYRWTLGPVVVAKIYDEDTGEWKKRTAGACYGADRTGDEQEFIPLDGYHSGLNDIPSNLGIAMSDIPLSWPVSWPMDGVDAQFPVGSEGFKGVMNGEVKADREVYFAAVDSMNNNGAPGYVMGCRIDVWGLQWADFLNRNFIIYKFVVTNVSDKEWKDVYIGIHDDPDCPEEGDNEWTDDFAAFIPKGDEDHDSLLWNFSYLWDQDDYVGGLFDAGGVGWVGLKVLETPIDPETNEQKGLTAVQVFEYSTAPKTEEDSYDQFAAGIMPPQNVDPHPDDWTQTPNSYGPDVTYAVGSGPFDLKPGESLNFAFASVHGVNKADLFNNAILCQTLYNNEYVSAESPPIPELKAYESEGKVILYWDDRAEEGIYYAKNEDGSIQTDGNGEPIVDHVNDKLTGTNRFQGYKLYKSSDGGVTWGQAISDMKGVQRGFVPLAIYDKIDAVAGESESRPFFDLGDNTGLKHHFVDQNVKNGYEYLYALLAYDSEDTLGVLILPPIENAIPADPSIPGDNLIAVRPRGQAGGTTLGSADSAYAAQVAGESDKDSMLVLLFNDDETIDATYEITINEAEEGLTFNIKNKTTGKWAMTDNYKEIVDWPFYSELNDNPPVFDGLRPIVTDVSPGIKDYSFSGDDDSFSVTFDGIQSVYYGDTYELRWDEEALKEPGSYGTAALPFFVYNITKGTKCSHYLLEDTKNEQFDSGDGFIVIEADGSLTNIFVLKYKNSPVNGDVCSITMLKTLSAADKYELKTTKLKTSTIKESDLDGIRVVPNPYIFTSPYETGKFGGEKEIQFHYLPPVCTIRIFNLAGDLLQTIEHTNGTPIEAWNLRTDNDQEISFGVYLFHVEAEGIGEHIGKFAVIK